MFTSERLRFRPYKPSDLEHILGLYNDTSVATYLLGRNFYAVPLTEDKFKEFYVKAFQGALMFCTIEELASGAFVGFTIFDALQPKNRGTTFGIGISPPFQNKGYGKEATSFMVNYAFRNLGVHRVSLSAFEGNERAIGMYKKIGFVEEARVRKSVWIDGSWRDQIWMGILEEDWNTIA